MIYYFITTVAVLLQVLFIIFKIVGTEPISEWSWFVILLPLWFLMFALSDYGRVVLAYLLSSKLWWLVVFITALCYITYIIGAIS